MANAQDVQTALQRAIVFLGSDTELGIASTKHDNMLYNAYFKYVVSTDKKSAQQQWLSRFANLDAGHSFPPPSRTVSKPNSKTSTTYRIKNLPWMTNYSTDSQIFASWALLQ
jgi:hypothetical protein